MNRPLLCVTVSGWTTESLRTHRDAVGDADLVELRLDGVSDPDVSGALAGRRTPVIVTCRPRSQGGLFEGSEEERRRVLEGALRSDADYVDLEWGANLDDLIAKHRHRVVCSMHCFDHVPPDLHARYGAMRSTGAAIVKIAVNARRLTDLVPLLAIARNQAAGERSVLIGMGQAGIASRILAAHFGSCWSYARIDGSGQPQAPGQLTLDRLAGEFRYRDITASTPVYGVVGKPLAHSLSPAMHNAAFQAAGIDAVYVPFEAVDGDDFLEFAHHLGVAGASITAPYKRTLLPAIAEMDETARAIGSINTIRREGDTWAAINTDAGGFLDALAGRLVLEGTRAAIIGTGGAARAVVAALARAGARIAVYGRDPTRAADVAALAGGLAGELPPPSGSWDLLVNATPVGTAPDSDSTPIERAELWSDDPRRRVVYDLVYNPLETRLLRDARSAGCDVIFGLDMLVAQARRQFTWWTGKTVDPSVFREAALARLGAHATLDAGV